MTPLRIPVDITEELYIVEDEAGSVFVAINPEEPFTVEEPGGAFVCVGSAESAEVDLVLLKSAVTRALSELGARRRGASS